MQQVPEYKQDDPKLQSLIQEGVHGSIVLIGFPYDEGVFRNGGRRGAELGPDCLRRFFPAIGSVENSELGHSLEGFIISDYGNIMVADDHSLEAGHDKLLTKVKSFLNKPQSPALFVVGGGHDLSWPVSQGFLHHCETHDFIPVIINIDSRFEVSGLDDAGKIHAACPFRLVLETEKLGRLGGSFVAFGSQGSVCGKAHAEYIQGKGGSVTWFRTIRALPTRLGETQAGNALKRVLDSYSENHRVYLSFDLAAIDSSFCPGVSAPSVAGGLTAEEAVDLAYIAGLDKRVILMDAVEFNPSVEDFRTGRLLATMLYYFAMGQSTH